MKNNITLLSLDGFIVAIVIFNPKSDCEEVRVVVSRFDKGESYLRGDSEVYNMGDLHNIELKDNETWAFVYPNQSGLRKGAGLEPKSYEVAEALEGSVVEAKSIDVSGKNVEEIRDEVVYNLQNSFVSSF